MSPLGPLVTRITGINVGTRSGTAWLVREFVPGPLEPGTAWLPEIRGGGGTSQSIRGPGAERGSASAEGAKPMARGVQGRSPLKPI